MSQLAEGWSIPEDVAEQAEGYAGLQQAWSSLDSPPLMVWLAARLAPSTAALRGVMDTARRAVDMHLTLIAPEQLDLARLLKEVSRLGRTLDDPEPAWGQVVVCCEAAACALDLATADGRMAHARDDDWRRDGRREVPALLASACQHAQGAYGNFMSEFRGAFARLVELGDFIRARHTLRPDGSIVPVAAG
ncbi:MAG TPA: hypothetical protein VFF06_10605 [Polyangia bacterium]|nr:hypothetical protein [Polyangia bacterium]